MRITGIVFALLLGASQCAAITYERVPPSAAQIEIARADIANAPAPEHLQRSTEELMSMADRAAQRLRGSAVPFCASIEAEACAFSVRVVSDEEVFAGIDKDGTIWLTVGLLQYLETEDEVAATIAHEVAHRLNGDNFARAWATKLHQELRYVRGGSSPASAASRVSGSARRMISMEANADHLAVFLLHRAGYDLEAAERLWIVLEKMGDRKAAAIFAMHPHSPERLAAWRLLADTLGREPYLEPKRIEE